MINKLLSPLPGQKWHLPDYDVEGNPFETFIGNYQSKPGAPYVPELSVHYYRLEAGEEDKQSPHHEDELYFVLQGGRSIQIKTENETVIVPLKKGDLVFVPKHAPHKFVGEGQISLLVFFGPNFTGPTGKVD
jgi:mannose-6-phosphate isomerase-like protein (cupin superfamily)